MWLALGEYRGPSRVHSFRKYAEERAVMRARLHAYRCYMADGWWYHGQNLYCSKRYADVVDPPRDFDVQGVVDDVIARAGLEVKDGPA